LLGRHRPRRAARGIVYLTTGSPKPNFIGVNHHGDNLLRQLRPRLDAATGQHLWHFQEIRHDIWDLDIAAPPVLVTVTRNGKRYDAVAALTKIRQHARPRSRHRQAAVPLLPTPRAHKQNCPANRPPRTARRGACPNPSRA
jgi:quinoprotein glucose dehydrogenase